jgi:hypothetical protein
MVTDFCISVGQKPPAICTYLASMFESVGTERFDGARHEERSPRRTAALCKPDAQGADQARRERSDPLLSPFSLATVRRLRDGHRHIEGRSALMLAGARRRRNSPAMSNATSRGQSGAAFADPAARSCITCAARLVSCLHATGQAR